MEADIQVKSKCILLLVKEIMVVEKHSSLYLGLVLPSGRWQSLILKSNMIKNYNFSGKQLWTQHILDTYVWRTTHIRHLCMKNNTY